MGTKVAIVTGANKGIGLAIVKGLCRQYPGDVYLTARDVSRGQEAVSQLKAEGLEPRFHQLDITDKYSAEDLATFIKEKYGGLDVLVNNAGIMVASTVPVAQQAEETIRTNFWGTLNVCRALFPLLRPSARAVNISSLLTVQAFRDCSEANRNRMNSCTTEDGIGAIMDELVESAKAGSLDGWSSNFYAMSKIGISLATSIQQGLLDPDGSLDKVVNSCCPGYVSTDMTNFEGKKTTDEGADTPLYLAMLPQNTEIRGQFLASRKIKKWKK